MLSKPSMRKNNRLLKEVLRLIMMRSGANYHQHLLLRQVSIEADTLDLSTINSHSVEPSVQLKGKGSLIE
ncbi:MAG: hypothetical protein ACI90V_001968 [Bacillariaceae sp.]|jgi:hypothetical protein